MIYVHLIWATVALVLLAIVAKYAHRRVVWFEATCNEELSRLKNFMQRETLSNTLSVSRVQAKSDEHFEEMKKQIEPFNVRLREGFETMNRNTENLVRRLDDLEERLRYLENGG